MSSRVGAAFLFAIETGMRCSEITGIQPGDVNLRKRTCSLKLTKNSDSRKVALSKRAIELLKLVDCDFNLTSRQVDANFRKCRDQALIKDLKFHDTRHHAITNLAPKMHILDLARMVGIRDLDILMVYYNQTAENIAKLLD